MFYCLNWAPEYKFCASYVALQRKSISHAHFIHHELNVNTRLNVYPNPAWCMYLFGHVSDLCLSLVELNEWTAICCKHLNQHVMVLTLMVCVWGWWLCRILLVLTCISFLWLMIRTGSAVWVSTLGACRTFFWHIHIHQHLDKVASMIVSVVLESSEETQGGICFIKGNGDFLSHFICWSNSCSYKQTQLIYSLISVWSLLAWDINLELEKRPI